MKKIERLISFQKEFIIYLLSPELIITSYLAFHFFTTIVDNRQGYLWGMIFYWLIGCSIPIFLWTSKRSRKLLLHIKKINWWQVLLLIVPIALALFFGPFKQRINEATVRIIILSLPYAFINAFCEEFLWRVFPELCKNETLLVYAKEDADKEFLDETYIEELAAHHFPNLSLSKLSINPKKFFRTWAIEKQGSILISGYPVFYYVGAVWMITFPLAMINASKYFQKQ